ncbi:helix-turn-helix domain-containing protein [Paraburkholderia hospita]|uniref:helix-turn-helix domain-containing protein n=1 Tax=Paraburkholderia hospita TaxID=169430 RepID=UPI0009A6A515|nr:helix-turn-helix domain-containing protein [Paraburkholderia hospita]SKC49548.1 Helix-turn-helix domain-containing protein [Paraburkholderia hospita]
MNSHVTQHHVAGGGRSIFSLAHNPLQITSTPCETLGHSSSNRALTLHNPIPLLDRQKAASYLGVKPQTLANWAVTRARNLPYVKIGRRVMYRVADLEAFVMANRHVNATVNGGANV